MLLLLRCCCCGAIGSTASCLLKVNTNHPDFIGSRKSLGELIAKVARDVVAESESEDDDDEYDEDGGDDDGDEEVC